MNNKHLTFEERSIIEDLLNKGEKIHKIAQKLGRPDFSIVREVQRNRYVCHNTQAFCIKFWKTCVKGLFCIYLWK